MLETALEVTVGNDVEFSFSVVNAGNTPIELTFRDACRADFAVYDDTVERWRYSDGKSFAQTLSTAEFQPGEGAGFEASWPNPEPGEYTVEATLRVSERNVSARTPFSV
ncbi:MAG: BsuPI-related putative proteinase inhibitor [Natronomonas sp.]